MRKLIERSQVWEFRWSGQLSDSCAALLTDPGSFLRRWIHSDDGSFPSEEEDRLLCHPDVPAVHHDSHSFPSVFLAEQRIGASQNCVWWARSHFHAECALQNVIILLCD